MYIIEKFISLQFYDFQTMKWIISDNNIPKFLKSLKAMTRIGPDVHFQTCDRTELKLQVVNNAHSVHFSLTLKETFFLGVEETLIHDSVSSNRTANTTTEPTKRCKLPIKYLLKCCGPSAAKFAEQLELGKGLKLYTCL